MTSKQKEALLDLRLMHNSYVKDKFACTSEAGFSSWFFGNCNFEEGYIEISAHETESGNAIQLDFNPSTFD
jgi:hypothetical protein|tara:strand:+ start:288 stop:500 length:213 start_codon:yes stop_codon:yes gene_type:complete